MRYVLRVNSCDESGKLDIDIYYGSYSYCFMYVGSICKRYNLLRYYVKQLCYLTNEKCTIVGRSWR